jgi:diguanylate cyclase (GGDEF)-like protein
LHPPTGGKAHYYRDAAPPRNRIGSPPLTRTPDPARKPPDPRDDEIRRLSEEVARLEQKVEALEILADRDPLTTIYNRRAFMRELHRVSAFCERYGMQAGVAFFDMDAFKLINDRHGHAAGDTALQSVAATLAAHVRESDVVGRLGGDEFAVILVQLDRAAAIAKAARLKQLVEAEPAVHEGVSIPLRITFGVRAFEPGVSPADLLAGADAAMYLNKPAAD